MEVKEMRAILKELDIKVPQKNSAVVELYNKEFDANEVIEEEVKNDKALKSVVSDNEYTYIGQGDTPPQIIKFMGLQVFTRGVATPVTDPVVLEKVKTNSSFVKGEIDGELLYANDEAAKKKVQAIRDEDVKLDIYMQRKNRS